MMQKSFLARLVQQPAVPVRQFSTAGNIQARFETAYLERTAAMAGKVVKQ